MMAIKQTAPVIIACLAMATGTAALANQLGTPGSALDPANYVAPVQNRLAKPTTGGGSAPIGDVQEEVQSTTTFVTMPGFGEPVAKPAEKGEKAPKAAKVKTKTDDGLLSGVNDKFKSAGSGIASGTKAAGDQMKKGTKVVGDGIASSAKASGSFFLKGARAIGSSTKKVGSKVAQSTKAAGDTMKDGTHVVADHMPFIGKSGKNSEVKSEKAVASKQEDLKPKTNDKVEVEEKVATTTTKEPVGAEVPGKEAAPKVAIKSETKTASKTSIVGKTFGTFGKLNVFHKKGGDAALETAGKTPSSADLTH